MPRLDHAAHAGERIDLRIPADDRAGIEHAVAADLRKVAEHRAEFLPPGFIIPLAVDDNVLLVALHVAGHRARAHVRFVAQHGIADIVIMRGLHLIKENTIFQFAGVTNHRTIADEHIPADERSGAHLGFFTDDARTGDAGRRRDRRGFSDPHILSRVIVIAQIQPLTDGQHRFADFRERFPRIFARGKHLCRAGMRQVKQIADFNRVHIKPTLPP